VREHVLVPAARRVFDLAGVEDQIRFDQIFDALCRDPSAARPIRTVADDIPETMYRYEEGEYRVVFDLPDPATLRVWMIGKGPA
jgi:hypothetical protein